MEKLYPKAPVKLYEEKEKAKCLFYDESERCCIFNVNFVCYDICKHRNFASKQTKDLFFLINKCSTYF